MDAYNPRMSLKSRQLRRPYLCALIASAIAVALAGCDDNALKIDAGGTDGCDGSRCMSSGEVDAGSDAGNDAAAMTMPQEHDAGDSGTVDAVDAGDTCHYDRDCDDHLYCNGVELCIPIKLGGDSKHCWRPEQGPCADRTCHEIDHSCDCSDADRDHDGARIPGCAERPELGDCDDTDDKRKPGLLEICDPTKEGSMTRDEDCDWNTVGDRDTDRDGNIDHNCANFDPQYLEYITGLDCDDSKSDIKFGAAEACDNIDNDCDGTIDEVNGAPSEKVHKFYVDSDGDTWGSAEFIETLCNAPPAGYAYETDDCDDTNPLINPMREEICNGKDDDCEVGVDKPLKEGDLLFDEPFDGVTKFVCKGEAGWEVETCPPLREDCNHDYHDACETRANTLQNCHACGQACSFACGAAKCDEVAQLAAGGNHFCATTTEGNAVCWGDNSDGQLGNDSTHDSATPGLVALVNHATVVAGGYAHTCAAFGDTATLYCWGSNASGQLGTTAVVDHSEIPAAVDGPYAENVPLHKVTDVALGTDHSCAVHDDGVLDCWGLGTDGRLGDNDAAEHHVPVPGSVFRKSSSDAVQDARYVAAGAQHSCMVTTAGGVECWGDNSAGQLGNGLPGHGSAPDNSSAAIVVAGLANVEEISAGFYHTCARSGGHVYCWGYNGDGQLGHESNDDDGVPIEVPGLDAVTSIAASDAFTCVVNAGDVVCWGSNDLGERGTADAGPTPQTIPDLPAAMSVVVAGRSACALVEGQRVMCWGDDAHGQLGHGVAGQPVIPPTVILPLNQPIN